MKQVVTIRNVLSSLDKFHREITSFCGRQGISSEITEEMFLVAEELLTNTISYGYEDEQPHQIEIEIDIAPDLFGLVGHGAGREGLERGRSEGRPPGWVEFACRGRSGQI